MRKIFTSAIALLTAAPRKAFAFGMALDVVEIFESGPYRMRHKAAKGRAQHGCGITDEEWSVLASINSLSGFEDELLRVALIIVKDDKVPY